MLLSGNIKSSVSLPVYLMEMKKKLIPKILIYRT